MKKFLFLLPLALLSCTHKSVTQESSSASDSLTIHVLQTVIDTNRSFIDIKDDVFRLIDTLQSHAEYHPDMDIRVGAKSFATTLSQLMLSDDISSPEEIQFFIDSFLLPLNDVSQVWYVANPPVESGLYPFMMQNIIRNRDEDDHSYITEIDVYLHPEGNRVLIFFPEDAIGGASIMFSKDDSAQELDTISFHVSDAMSFHERTDSTDMAIVFDDSLIEAMLTHKAMFIGYINDQYDLDIDHRFKDCMLILEKFQEQYPQFIKLR